ncbi:retropepsin-like domain-containing protein [candidate division KSB1 bacterium]|nr:retropepsin-like domain-containing protein [candidate division KSB1 bacterium]
MRIDGTWHTGDDGVVRPVMLGEILAVNDLWLQTPFLLDIGADRTVLSAGVLAMLGYRPAILHERLGGLGGVTDAVAVETRIKLICEDDKPIVFHGQYAAVTRLEALDISVLGRDILNLFGVIVDQSNSLVCMLRPPHRYFIEKW